jgi:uncharacterized membrane protein
MERRPQRVLRRLRERQNQIMSDWIVLALTAGFWLSVGCIVAGIVVALVRWNAIGAETEPIPDVLSGVIDGSPQAMVDLGILVLLLTPAATVVVGIVSAIAQRDRFLGLVCGILLLITLLSLVVGL